MKSEDLARVRETLLPALELPPLTKGSSQPDVHSLRLTIRLDIIAKSFATMIQRSEIWLLVVALSVIVSCTHQTRQASIGDFTDQVLEPLAVRIADEKIIEETALARAAQIPAASHQTIAAVLQELPWIGKMLTVVNTTRQAYLDQDLAWLETRRIPLRHELLSIFRSRTQQDGNTFSFCVNDVERRYETIEQGRFSRLADGSGPCETTPLQSLKRNSAG